MCLTASRSEPGSGLCGTQAREAPQPRGKVSNPSSALRSRSDTHSGLLQAFFSVLGSQRHLLATWRAGCSCLPSPTQFPHVRLLRGSLGCLRADPPLWRGSTEKAPEGAHTPPPASSQPCFAAPQFFLLMAAGMSPFGQAPRLSRALVPPKPSQPLGPRQGTENQHRKDHLGVRPWPLPPLEPLPLLAAQTSSPSLRQLKPEASMFPRPPRSQVSADPQAGSFHLLPPLEHGKAAQQARA